MISAASVQCRPVMVCSPSISIESSSAKKYANYSASNTVAMNRFNSRPWKIPSLRISCSKVTKNEDYEKYSGFPILGGIEWGNTENPHVRRSLGMKPGQKGIRIAKIDPTSAESKVLKPSDIIVSIDGLNVDNDGTVLLRNGERVDFSYLLSHKDYRDSTTIEVLRNSEILSFNIELRIHASYLPPLTA